MNNKKMLFFGVLVILVVSLIGCTQNTEGQENNPENNSNIENTGGNEMAETVENGDTIKVNYKGTLEDGTEFDSSLKPGREPLEFTVGAGQMISGFDATVVGMKLNEEKTVTLEPSEAYGEPNPELIQEIPKEQFGENFEQLQIGQKVPLNNGASATVVEKTETSAKLDFNHELAGKRLVFWIQIVEIRKA